MKAGGNLGLRRPYEYLYIDRYKIAISRSCRLISVKNLSCAKACLHPGSPPSAYADPPRLTCRAVVAPGKGWFDIRANRFEASRRAAISVRAVEVETPADMNRRIRGFWTAICGLGVQPKTACSPQDGVLYRQLAKFAALAVQGGCLAAKRELRRRIRESYHG